MKNNSTKTTERRKGLPVFLKPYVWDTELTRVDSVRHQFYLIERVLEYGDDRAIHWLRENYTRSQIARVVRSSCAISRNTANLWSLVLKIPRERIQRFSRPSLFPHSVFSRA